MLTSIRKSNKGFILPAVILGLGAIKRGKFLCDPCFTLLPKFITNFV